MADGTVMTGQGDTAPAEGNQGQGSSDADASTPDQATGQGGGEQRQGDPAAEPGKGEQGGTKNGEGEGNGKPDGEGDGDSQAPEAYEWAAPEGFEGELDQAAIEQFEPIAKELGLTQEQANKMVGLHAESIQRAQQQARENWARQLETWQTELREDPDFGGAKFDESVATAVKAVEKFGSPGLKEALEQTGMGNHPELVRTFAAIGKAISEDKIHMGNQSHGERSAADILYPNEAKK